MAPRFKNPLFDLLGKPAYVGTASIKIISEEKLEEIEERRARWRKQQADARARKRKIKPPRVPKHDEETRAAWAKYQRDWQARRKMTPESKVKAHLVKRIKELGGEVRFAKWIGRNGCPDTRVMLPRRSCWVETKDGKNGELSSVQQREINRMRRLGEVVLVLTTIEEIDNAFPAV